MEKSSYLPRARTQDLIVEELTDEVLVYDIRRNKAHCLNPTAAAIWKQCDGRRTVEQIARRLITPPTDLATELGRSEAPRNLRVDKETVISDQRSGIRDQELREQVVWLALDQLSRNHLLKERVPLATAVPRISRRQALMRVGIGAAIALPIVVSITAPTAVQAGSCFTSGHNCGTSSQCGSGLCSGGSCT